MPRTQLPVRTMNKDLHGPDGSPVTMIESRWRQGLFIATEGVFQIEDQQNAQWTIWADAAPPRFDVEVLRTDGALAFYNLWDSGRQRRRESQSHTSGMYVEDLGDGMRRYSCNDIGFDPDFGCLAFTVALRS